MDTNIRSFLFAMRGVTNYATRVDLPYEWQPLYQRDDEPFVPPRRVLADCMPRRDHIIADLWALGMEAVFGRSDKEVLFIAAENEGGGLAFEEGGEEYEALLDEARTTVEFMWHEHYIIRASGLYSVTVKQVPIKLPERVFVCDIHEGEGWWARMVFAVRGE